MKLTVLNVNDNVPVFEKNEYRFNINENQPAGTLLGMVTASDGDGDLLKYKFTGDSTGNTSNLMIFNNLTVPSFTKRHVIYNKTFKLQQKIRN